MKFLLRLLWAQNGFVNNQTHKPSPSSCMFLFTTSQTVFNIQKLPYPFRLTQNNVSIYFASFLKWRFHALTLRKLYKKPSLTLSTLEVQKLGKPKNFATRSLSFWIPHFLRFCLPYKRLQLFFRSLSFWKPHFLRFCLPYKRLQLFFAPVPAIKLPLLPKSCVHMFISLFSEILSHKMNKLK